MSGQGERVKTDLIIEGDFVGGDFPRLVCEEESEWRERGEG